MDRTILITLKVLVTVLVFSLAIYLLIKLGPIFGVIFTSFFLVLSLEPAVEFFESKTLMNKPVPRSMAVGATFFLFIIVIVFILTVGLTPIVSQAQKLLVNLSQWLTNLPGLEGSNIQLENLVNPLSSISENVVDVTSAVFSNLWAVLSVLFFSLYMSLDWENIKGRFLSLFSGRLKGEISETIDEVEVNIGYWVKGQLTLMLIVGLASFLGLLVVGIDYPLALGLVSGLLEIVPVMGSVAAAIVAGLVGFSISPIKGLVVIILYIVIQQFENNFLVPKVMQKVSGFSPLVILLVLLIGSTLFGIVGAILAIPVLMVGVVIIKRVLRYS